MLVMIIIISFDYNHFLPWYKLFISHWVCPLYTYTGTIICMHGKSNSISNEFTHLYSMNDAINIQQLIMIRCVLSYVLLSLLYCILLIAC